MQLTGHIDEISRGVITGWAVDTAPPVRPAEVVILVNGIEHARIMPNLHRPGLTRRYPGSDGNFGFEHQFRPSLSVFRPQHVSVMFAETGAQLPGGSKTIQPVSSGPETSMDAMRPVLVNGAGRSGSTLLMDRLSLHPQIIAARRVPHEVKLLTYYSAALRTLAATADRQASADPESMTSDLYHLGFNPYNRPSFYTIARDPQVLAALFEDEIPTILAGSFKNIVRKYYAILAADSDKGGVTHFAEKISLADTSRYGPRALFGEVREIVLVRDPRDLLCSERSFWHLDWNAALDSVRASNRDILRIRSDAASDVLLVRYEDLITQERLTLERIGAFVGLTHPWVSTSEHQNPMFAGHATSSSPAASIGRFRSDLSGEELTQCNLAFGAFCEAFDYSN